MSADIIQFPTKKGPDVKQGQAADIEKFECEQMSIAADAIDALVYELIQKDYDPLSSPELISDLGVILNCTYAMLLRHDGRYHVLHHHINEMAAYLEELKTLMDNHKDLFEDT